MPGFGLADVVAELHRGAEDAVGADVRLHEVAVLSSWLSQAPAESSQYPASRHSSAGCRDRAAGGG